MQTSARSETPSLRVFLVNLPTLVLSLVLALGASRYQEPLFWGISIASDIGFVLFYKGIQDLCRKIDIDIIIGDVAAIFGQLIFWAMIFYVLHD